MKHIELLAALGILILPACTHTRSISGLEPVDTPFQVITTDSLIGKPISAHAINDTSVIINDSFGNQLIKQFSLTSGNLTQATAHPGIGPGEVIPPIRCTVANDTLYILSLSTKDLFTSPLDSLNLSKRSQLPTEATGIFYLPYADRFIVPVMHFQSADVADDAYAYVYDRNFNKTQELTGFPALWGTEQNLDNRILSKFHQIQGISELTGNTIAVLETHVLRLYDFKNGMIEHNSDILLFPYEYNYSAPSPGSEVANTKLQDGFKLGAKDIAACNGNFLITVNNTIKGDDTQEYGITIVAIDRKGNPLAEYRPDTPIQPYPITTMPDNSVVVFTDGENILPATTRLPI